MWDNLYEILFNPNHEMPLGVLIGIPVAAVLFNWLMPRYAQRKAMRKRFDKAAGRDRKKK